MCIYYEKFAVLLSIYVYTSTLFAAGDQPLNLSAIQEGPTSLRIYWVKPVIKRTIGYRIYYSGGSTGHVDIDDPQVDNYLLTGLKNNVTYHISIAGRSNHLPSYRLNYTTQLGKTIIVYCMS